MDLLQDRPTGGVVSERSRPPAVRMLAMFFFFVQLVQATVFAQDGRSYLDMSGGYITGDFGTPTRSELYYLQPTFGYVAPLYDVSVAVPYVYVSNTTGGATTSESGIGDVILHGGRVLVPEGDGGFSFDGSLAMKLPTADKNKGLGTGEADYGAFANGHQRLGPIKLNVFAGYINVGKPANVNYQDIYLYGIGLSSVIEFTELFASFEGRRAMTPGAENPEEIHAGFFHALNTDYAVKAEGFAGLNNGGPAVGFSMGVVRWF